MTDSEKLLILAALADGWKQSVDDWLSADEVSVRLNRWMERGDEPTAWRRRRGGIEQQRPTSPQGVSSKLLQLARQGLVEQRKEWAGFHTYRCSESVRKLFA